MPNVTDGLAPLEVEAVESDLSAAPLPQSQPDPTPSTFARREDFWQAVADLVISKGRKVDPRLKEYNAAAFAGVDATKALTAQTGSGGGFLLPSTQLTDIMSVAIPMMIMRLGATIINMSTRSVQIPLLDQSGTSAVDHFFGGVQGFWTEEGDTLTPSEVAFRFTGPLADEPYQALTSKITKLLGPE